MKNKEYSQVQALKTYLTQKKWWLNIRLEKLWITTQLNTRALVLYIFNNRYILLDKHYNQLNVHKSRIRESYEEVVKKHNKLCEFITEITPESKRKKSTVTFPDDMVIFDNNDEDTCVPRDNIEPYVQIPTNWRTNTFTIGDLADDINE